MDAKTQVLGISIDSVESHEKFAEKLGLPYPILADASGDVARRYGVFVDKYGGIAARSIFLVDEAGKLVFVDREYSLKGEADHDALLRAVNAAGPTSREAATGPAATTEYDALVRFVPPGMESVMFVNLENHGAPERLRVAGEEWGAAVLRARPVRAVLAGRRFEKNGRFGHDYVGVTVLQCDTEVDGPPVDEDYVVSHELVADRDVWQLSASSEGPTESWAARPAPRIVLRATRKEALEAALRGAAPGADALVRSMGWKRPVDWGSPVVIVRRYDRDNLEDVFSPLNTTMKSVRPLTRGFRVEGFLLEFDPEGVPGFRAWVRTEDPELARCYYEELLIETDPSKGPLKNLPARAAAPGEILLDAKFPAAVCDHVGDVLLRAFGFNAYPITTVRLKR